MNFGKEGAKRGTSQSGLARKKKAIVRISCRSRVGRVVLRGLVARPCALLSKGRLRIERRPSRLTCLPFVSEEAKQCARAVS